MATLRIFLGASILLLVSGQVKAELVTWQLSGTIDDNGDHFSGIFAFDSSRTDLNGSGQGGQYNKGLSNGVPTLLPEAVTEPASTPTPKPTILEKFTYLGAFRLSSGAFGPNGIKSSLNYSPGPMAYNPDNHSLFIAGHRAGKALAEFSIPELVDGANLSDLNTGGNIQPFVKALEIPGNPSKLDRYTGMLYVDGQLIVNAVKKYDTGNSADTTIVIRDANNLSGVIDGWYELPCRAECAGYMSHIPPEWQAAFGSSYLTGWATNNSIVSRLSVGPSLWTFDYETMLAGVQKSGPISATAHLNYPYKGEDGLHHYIHPDAVKRTEGSASPIWNILSSGKFGFIVPGKNIFAVFGRHGGVNSGVGYKITQDNGNECGGYCSYVAADNYTYYWLYDVQEILDAANPWEPQPYEYGKLTVDFDHDETGKRYGILTGTFDHVSGTLYLALNRRDREKGARTPVVVAYNVNF